ncbi:bacterio-opsin activator-like protein, partial [Haloferax sp. BAB-2207]
MTETTDETSADPVTVLLVDDNRDWLALVLQRLREEAPDFDVREANSPEGALDRLTDDVECVVSDYYMPGRTGIELLSEVREHRPDIPFLLFTGAGNEGLASSALSAGANDYIVKTSVGDSAAALATRVRTAVDKHRTERALAESEARYRTLVENVRDAIFVARDGGVVLVNEAATTLTGYDRAALTDGDIVETVVHPDDRARVRDALDLSAPRSLDIRIRDRAGETRHCILDIDYRRRRAAGVHRRPPGYHGAGPPPAPTRTRTRHEGGDSGDSRPAVLARGGRGVVLSVHRERPRRRRRVGGRADRGRRARPARGRRRRVVPAHS